MSDQFWTVRHRRLSASRLGIMALALTCLMVAWPSAGADAVFSSSARNAANKLATAAIYPPTALTASAVGHAVQLGWTAPAVQNGSAYVVNGVANGLSSNCTGVTFASLGTPATTTYTDTGRYTPEGSYFCYQVKTTYGGWSSQDSVAPLQVNPRTAARLGFVAESVTYANGGSSGSIDQGDTIVVVFNQPVDTTAGSSPRGTVCSTLGVIGVVPAVIVIGSTTASGACSSGETATVGKTSSSGLVIGSGRWNATFAWTNSNKTLTITLGSRTDGVLGTPSPATSSFTPTTTAAELKSATGGFHICDTTPSGGACTPTPSGSF